MCERCIAEEVVPRRRFLRLAAASAVSVAAGAAFNTQIAEAKKKPKSPAPH
jgi:hypothetical protein